MVSTPESPQVSAWPDGRRVIVEAFGETPPEAVATRTRLEVQPAPDPASLDARDVLVRVRSASVGWVDLLMTSGQYQHVQSPPYTPGLEFAGEVLWIGAGAANDSSLRVGDAVLVDGLLSGPRSHGAHQRWGGFATYAVAPVEAVHRVPGRLTFDQACNLLGNYETAWHCLVHRGRVQRGETVLVLGASGSTGLAAVHVAGLCGATVIATGRSPEKLARVADEGAAHTLVTGADQPPLRDRVKSLTGGRGVDIVYDGVGGELSVEAMRCLRFGGRHLVVGWAATPFVARGQGQRGAPNANQLPTNIIMMKGLDVLGCPAVISIVENPALRPPRLAQILSWAASGVLSPVVSQAHPLEAFREAMMEKWRGAAVGGIVLHP
jgi:NADPH2:quinone reductase